MREGARGVEELKRCGRVKQVSKGYFHDYNELKIGRAHV